MNPDDVTIGLNFNQDLRGGIQPSGTTIELRVTREGLFDTGGLGGAGQQVEPVSFDRIAETLTSHYDRPALVLALQQLVRLHDAVAHGAADHTIREDVIE